MRFYVRAFSLAEIMIVLTVVGVLTAILLPAAFHATPDENVMKFKKANSTLGTVIRELVNSDEYYSGGDLGIRADGTLIDGTHDGDTTYFCETFADNLNTKNVNCSEIKNGDVGSAYQTGARIDVDCLDCIEGSDTSLETGKRMLDELCKKYINVGNEIVTTDGVSYYQTSPGYTFGVIWDDTETMNLIYGEDPHIRLFNCHLPDNRLCFPNSSGFDRIYKPICIDVDGIPANATSDNCINECPFGYGIRADGKIFPGARATEWMEKSVQGE